MFEFGSLISSVGSPSELFHSGNLTVSITGIDFPTYINLSDGFSIVIFIDVDAGALRDSHPRSLAWQPGWLASAAVAHGGSPGGRIWLVGPGASREGSHGAATAVQAH